MVDEDFNRTWGRLDQPATTVETRRAQVVKPFVERADLLLDLHSMHDDGVPLMLAGPLAKGVALAKKVGTPVDIIADAGHAAGMRMRDYGGFGDPKSPKNALLIETGQHWRASSVVVAKDVTARFLAETGIVEAADLPAGWKQPTPRQAAGRRGHARHRHQARQLQAGAQIRRPGGGRQGGHRAGPRRGRGGDDALRQLRAGDAVVQPAAQARRHCGSPGSIGLTPGSRRSTKRSSDRLITPSIAPSAK